MTTPQDEVALVERAKQDPDAFGELYERHVDRIYNYIYYRTGNVRDAEDLTSRTFYRALRSIERYKQKGVPFSAWLYRIAHNLVANWHRDRSRRKLIYLDELVALSEGEEGPEESLDNLADQEWLRVAIRQLSSDRQLLLVLKFSEGLSNAEIGQIMGRSEGAVKSLYHRTLIALRKELVEGARLDEDDGVTDLDSVA
jgi:RNA polymerase sigma-70 factor (ECF subfamily)